jgi:putative hemolysin
MTTSSWQFFFIFTLCCLVIQAFYAMMEMACVSFNKVRLQYYISKDMKRAHWLSYLLTHPSQLFGTTLIGVNAALQLGSEASRRFYESVGLSPDWAPLSQIFLVLIFAEIAPLLAGRRYPEHTAMLGIPILYFSSLLLKPIIFSFDLLCRFCNWLIGSPKAQGLYLSREEFQKILEAREEAEPEEFHKVVSNIFTLKNKIAKELMQPLAQVKKITSATTVGEVRYLLKASYSPYLPLYIQKPHNIVGIIYPRDLLRLKDQVLVRHHARSPWFVTEKTSILQILKQFRRNNQSVAVILNERGLAIGILTLDAIIDEIFGSYDQWDSFEEVEPLMHDLSPTQEVLVERSFPGEMKIADFNRQFNVHLNSRGTETLEELLIQELGHTPIKGESIRIDDFELTVEEGSLLGIKTISIKSL